MTRARPWSAALAAAISTTRPTVANGLLIVRSRPVSTMMACNPEAMRLEQDFLDGLTRITSSTLDNTGNPRRLTLLLSSGDTLDFGRRIDPATGGQMGPKKLVYVDSERVPCNAGAGRAMCYQVRDSAAQPWQLWYGDITGFNFQPGVRYRLRVVEVRDPNPPADASGEMGAGRGGRAGAGAALRPGPGAGPPAIMMAAPAHSAFSRPAHAAPVLSRYVHVFRCQYLRL